MVTQDFNDTIDLILKDLDTQGFTAEIEKGQVVNLISLKCPEPLMMLRQAFRTAASGAQFIVFAPDPSTERDFASFCRFSNHKMLHNQAVDTGMAEHTALYVFILEKGSA